MNKCFLIAIVVYALCVANVYSQGIKGIVKNVNNEPIEFATIYAKEIGTGSSTNIEGVFQMPLTPGTYNLVFQHLGFKAKELKVLVAGDYLNIDVVMEPEIIVLSTVVITGNNEDPAYTIMRKAISKAKYHKQQLNSFETEVYIKGSGRLIDSPFFLRKTMAKEGIDSTTSYASESVSLIKYTRPNTYKEEVISIRSNGDDFGTNPNSFILGSLYDPLYVNAISPLSPKAFGYYKFEYLGTKLERGHEISKIKVTPRSKGDEVFWGEISIVEDVWSIQSTNLFMQNMGIEFNVKQIYEPIESAVWMPISHKFDITGSVFGFEFEAQYLSTMGKYTIELNKDLAQKFEIVDESIEKELAKALKDKPTKEIETTLAEGGELTRKQFRKLINNYEKEERKEEKEPSVKRNYTIKIDSTANTLDSAYWAQTRPVPLTDYEIKGYYVMDSTSLAEKNEAEGDTLVKNKRSSFQFMDALTSYTFKWGKNDRLTYYSPAILFYYNTVEGFNTSLKFKYVHTFENKAKLFLWPQIKYGFESERLYGKLHSTFRYGPIYKRSSVSLNGGIYSNQLNNENPISPLVNTLTAIFWKGNYLKLYESRYVTASNKGYFSDRLSYNVGATFENRIPLSNASDYTWSKKSKEYTSNTPENIEVASTDFVENDAFLFDLKLEYKPWLKYSIRNGKKSVINSSSPSFDVKFKAGLPFGNLEADFQQLEIGYKQSFRPGIRGQFFIDARAGSFLGSNPTTFIDYQHFAGNETPFLMENPVGSYRLLPYYLNSTADKYASAQVLYQFRKFLFTQLPVLRMTGVKELAYVSYLVTPSLGNYVEVGYGLDNLFRILRLEASASFIDGNYNGYGIKIGVSTSITSGDGSISIGF